MRSYQGYSERSRGGRRDDHQHMRKVIIDERPTNRSTTIL
ncbi:hypothetical protein I551_5119 [Mycobacterium ulcerans str. Harvey]|uniref:Uncharacterized protein n=1 Tax=Mycobacterium ulcerans str. Harvey TaxID=1299332 RepID=A0ABN0QUX7_MYCUL|nr:hypothetical protein I551_5119 [Mycobacterium ulcerans str. Harvey]